MTKLFERYVRGMHDLWGAGYWVTWQPSVRLHLGDIGDTSGGQFVPIDDLKRRAISFEAVPADSRDSLTFQSEGGVDISFGAGAGAPVELSALVGLDVGAQATVEFVRDDAFLVVLRELAETRLASQPELAKTLVQRHAAGDWEDDQAVVSHLVRGSGIVLASSTAGTRVDISAGAKGELLVLMKLVGASVEGGVSRTGALDLHVAGADLTPYFRVMRLRRDWLHRLRIRYGDSQPFREVRAQTSTAFHELLEEATDEPEAVVEEVDQLSLLPDENDEG
jgi:hypothetical protein